MSRCGHVPRAGQRMLPPRSGHPSKDEDHLGLLQRRRAANLFLLPILVRRDGKIDDFKEALRIQVTVNELYIGVIYV